MTSRASASPDAATFSPSNRLSLASRPRSRAVAGPSLRQVREADACHRLLLVTTRVSRRTLATDRRRPLSQTWLMVRIPPRLDQRLVAAIGGLHDPTRPIAETWRRAGFGRRAARGAAPELRASTCPRRPVSCREVLAGPRRRPPRNCFPRRAARCAARLPCRHVTGRPEQVTVRHEQKDRREGAARQRGRGYRLPKATVCHERQGRQTGAAAHRKARE